MSKFRKTLELIPYTTLIYSEEAIEAERLLRLQHAQKLSRELDEMLRDLRLSHENQPGQP